MAHGETLALAWAELGQVLLALGSDDDATICYERALRLAWAHHRGSRWGTAKRIYRAVGRQPPELPFPERVATVLPKRRLRADEPRARALCNLGQVLLHVERRVDDATSCFERASELDPQCGDALIGLAQAEQDEAPERAEPLYRRALELMPERRAALSFELLRLRAELCDWSQRDADVAELTALAESCETLSFELPPFELNHWPIPARLHLHTARCHAARQRSSLRRTRPLRHDWDVHERRRIAYLSPDFRRHAVGRLIWDLFRHHDRERFEVFAYSLVDVDDPFRLAIEDGCDHFVDCSQSTPASVAQRINADEIDILIDLGGYSTHSRPEILARQPAPIQISWLGYLDTLGAPWVGWVIADSVILPDELAACSSERPLRLPDCFLASSPIHLPQERADRTAHGLPCDAFVFACFNHPKRIGPEVFDVWMRILDRVPNSVLWLYDRGLANLHQNLRIEAADREIDPRRLVFASALPREEHLSRLRLVDLGLDTFTYNGGATALEMLRAGAPIVTCPGSTMLGRMGASLCTAAGIPETVCASIQDYEDLAVRLATEGDQLAELRARLGDALETGPLFDLPRFVAQLESIFDSVTVAHRDSMKEKRSTS